MSELGHRFMFVSCQPGAEAVLKQEIAREHPELRFAFSRPGFVTFKSPTPLDPGFQLRSVFARAYGLSLGESRAPEASGRAQEGAALARGIEAKGKLVLHAWERETQEPAGAQAADSEILSFAPQAEVLLRDAAPEAFLPPRQPEAGSLVFDLILVEPEHWFFGFHQHSPAHSRDPGGMPAIVLPEKAPSRAYLKLEEGLRWAGVDPRPGQRAIEIGSSPGGATFALLQRGLDVIGIDPAAMDPAVLAFGPGRFRHLKKGVLDVTRTDLGSVGAIHWVLLDMNVPPQIALASLEHVGRLIERPLGAFLTLKLNRWRIAAEIPGFLERIQAMGFDRVRATQLPSNRQEFFVCALSS
jgi:23S rRNA (cytidine2498-2'-O)-methyltransferase